jgi:hypothetical protein
VAFTIPNEADAFHADQAEPDKVDIDILVAGLNGNGVVSGCAVTAQGTPDMTVAVAAGVTRNADGTTATVASGNVTITTADATNPRIDLVVVSNAGVKSVTAGTAAASPVFPAIPANSVVLAAVYVPANDTTIATNQITDKRVVLVTFSGSSFPASPRAGDLFWRSDLALDFYYDGTRWLTTTLYEHHLGGTVPSISLSATSFYSTIPWAPTYDLWLVRLEATLYASGLSGSAYWQVDLYTWDGSTQGSSIATVNNQSGSSSTMERKSAAIGALLGTDKDVFGAVATKVGAPGNLILGAVILYRIVAT